MTPRDGNDDTGSEPNLELPSLFGKRRKKSQAAPEPTEPVSSAPPATAPPATAPPAADPTTATRPLRPIAGAKRMPPSPPPSRGPEMTYDAPGEGTAVDEPTSVITAPAPPQTEDLRGEAAGETQQDPAKPPRRKPSISSLPRPSMPSMSPRLAAVVTGVAVALTGIAMLWLFLQGCTAVRGVSSCGGFGLVGIVVTLVAQVIVAAVLLTALKVAEPRSTAALGVGISATVAMVLFYASTPALAMAIAMLVLTPAAYVVASGVTTAQVDLRD